MKNIYIGNKIAFIYFYEQLKQLYTYSESLLFVNDLNAFTLYTKVLINYETKILIKPKHENFLIFATHHPDIIANDIVIKEYSDDKLTCINLFKEYNIPFKEKDINLIIGQIDRFEVLRNFYQLRNNFFLLNENKNKKTEEDFIYSLYRNNKQPYYNLANLLKRMNSFKLKNLFKTIIKNF